MNHLFITTANKALEEKLQEMNSAKEKTGDELRERIQCLEKELDNANELLSDSKHRGQSQLLSLGFSVETFLFWFASFFVFELSW